MNDRGAVTVEAAVAVCGLLVVLALGVAGVTAVIGQLRCVDAAREAARVIARGEPARAEPAVRAIGPPGARLAVRIEADTVRVEVSAGSPLPGLRLRAEAYGVLES